MGVTLPQIQHPLSRMSNPGDMDIRGMSRSGDRPLSNPPGGRPLANESHYPIRKSLSALSGRDSRAGSRLSRDNFHPQMNIGSIPEGVEVTYGDPNKTRMPIFGKTRRTRICLCFSLSVQNYFLIRNVLFSNLFHFVSAQRY